MIIRIIEEAESDIENGRGDYFLDFVSSDIDSL